MNDEFSMSELLEKLDILSEINVSVNYAKKSLEDLNERVKQLEKKNEMQAKTEYVLLDIQKSLTLGNKRFELMEARIDKIEKTDGDKAVETINAIVRYVLIAFIGAVLANIAGIINFFKK